MDYLFRQPPKGVKMSASIEDLLQQIIELETAIQSNINTGKNVTALQEKLFVLKEQFQLLSENLNKTDKILKG
jgi:hypothetical protein